MSCRGHERLCRVTLRHGESAPDIGQHHENVIGPIRNFRSWGYRYRHRLVGSTGNCSQKRLLVLKVSNGRDIPADAPERK